MTLPETSPKGPPYPTDRPPGAAGAGHEPSGPQAAGGAANTLGKYRLIAELSRGSMGIVYLGVSQGPAGFSKLLVIKELRPEAAEDPEFLRMFLDEARLAARLNHANIVQTYEVEDEGGRYFMAMEYLEGQTLHRLLDLARRPGPGPKPPRGMLLRVLSEALSGLHHAHELCDFDGTPLGVVHRDVSPKNVFLTYDGRAKLMDFGIAKAKDAMHVTVAGVLKGKVTYMAPEQALNLPVDRRADLFAAGVMLWEMLVGRKLWDKVPINGVLLRLTRHDLPPAPGVLVADLPDELDRICARALAPAREERYQTALEFREDLERYLTDSGEEVHPREVGQFLASTFAEERAARRALIEGHVRRVGGPSAGEIARLPGPAPHESVGRIRAAPPQGAGAIAASSYGPPPNPAFGPLPTPLTAVSPPPPPQRRRPYLAFAAIALLGSLATAALGVTLALRPGRAVPPNAAATAAPPPNAATAPPPPNVATAAPPPNAATAPPPPEPAPSAAPAPLTTLTLRVTPPGARVFLDGAELPRDAPSSTHPRDGRTHRLRVEAEGHLPYAGELAFDAGERELAVALDKAPAEAAPPPPPPRTRAPRAGSSRGGESRGGESRAGESRAGESRGGESRAGESRAGESRAGESREGEPAAPADAPAPPRRPKRRIDASNPYGGD
ncbi:MAG TPA: serine/threonine-protein kinase [Polyangiaceae bacterium]|nr:serine/threonine-protein kinase [Polyangiaceae bacterium]